MEPLIPMTQPVQHVGTGTGVPAPASAPSGAAAGRMPGASPFMLPEPDADPARGANAYTIAGIALGVFLAVVTVGVLIAAVVVAVRAN